MSQALYRKYRPKGWAEVYGQDHVIRTIQNAIRTERVGHAYLFSGPRGTGKTSTARLLAKAVNCLAEAPLVRPCNECAHCIAVNEGRFLDLIEIDAASNTSVDDIRDLRDKINFSPTQGEYKVYIIDEVHMLSTAAFNALLKTLEEPPRHAIFILATTEVHKIPATVLSRCQRHSFRRIPVVDIVKQLQEICTAEAFEVADEVLYLIARQSNGGMRDAISLLDQLTSTGDELKLELVQEVLGTATNSAVVELANAILERDAKQGLGIIHDALDEGSDPRQFARQVVGYLRDLMLIRVGNSEMIDATQDLRSQMVKQANGFEPERLVEVIRYFSAAASNRNTSWFPGLPLELAMAESVEHKVQPVVMEPQTANHPAKKSSSLEQNKVAKPETKKNKQVGPAIESEPIQLEDGGSLTIRDIHQNWKRIHTLARKYDIRTAGLLNSCKPVALKEGKLILGFQSDVVKSKMEDGKNIELTRRVIVHLMHAQVEIQCLVMNEKVDFSTFDPSQVSDGMVGEALNLGGQIKKTEKYK